MVQPLILAGKSRIGELTSIFAVASNMEKLTREFNRKRKRG